MSTHNAGEHSQMIYTENSAAPAHHAKVRLDDLHKLAQKLKDFSDQKDKLNQNCPQIPRWAYKIAKKGIQDGEGSYSVDQQIAEVRPDDPKK